MVIASMEKEILDQLAKLALEQQQMVLAFARALAHATPTGTPGKELLRFSGEIASEDLTRMAQAIQEHCEQVIEHEW